VVKAIAALGRDRAVAAATDFCRDVESAGGAPYWHHIGIYAFRRTALERFVLLAPSERETSRRLEQMRALDAGMTIAVARVDRAPFGVDTPADLARVRAEIEASGSI
jgi:3-deoxy-manno-octulosonate cytidylyltransferase (CMP-KDO synthetase)